jgi:tetratricopeptide (TPR) repeat protein/tRNA A-37 threonylcarbamoyl transferase component Bud32
VPDPVPSISPSGITAANDPAATLGEAALNGAHAPPADGRYELGEEIARGGMGVVYRATDTTFGREVAVKVLHERFDPSSGVARRFADEARITGQLQHPAIPPAHDLGTLPDGRPFLAMKLIRGQTLDSMLAERPDPTRDRGRFVAVFEQVCQAVAYAHAHQVIHRDLKPSNVMVGAFGEVQVMDWGLAKVLTDRERPDSDPDATAAGTAIRSLRESDGSFTQAGSVLGTPAFMPPEQAVGAVGKVDARSDVFGLGAVLAVILTGQPPFAGSSAETTRVKAAQGDVAECFARLNASGADPEMVALCKRCLAPKREDRPADAGEVAKSVAGLRAAADERARRAELDRVKAEGDRKRRRVQTALAAAVLVIVAGGAATAWWIDRQAGRQRTAALQRELEDERREADERARLARSREALVASVVRCEDALRVGDADSAGVAMEQIEKRLGEGHGPEFGPRVGRCRSELAMLVALDGIHDSRWTPDNQGEFPPASATAARIGRAFAGYGIVPGTTPSAEACRLVADSLIGDRLLGMLDLWLVLAPSQEVSDILGAADPDRYREAMRAGVLAGDWPRVSMLAEQEEALGQPPRFLVAVGAIPKIPVERRRVLLERTAFARPNDLNVLMGLAETYAPQRTEDGKTPPPTAEYVSPERVRWLQSALAVRPRNRAVRFNLGLVLIVKNDAGGAAALAREGIWLDPRDRFAHMILGNSRGLQRDWDGAAAAYRDLVRLDPQDPVGHLLLGTALKVKGDWDGVAAESSEAIRLKPEIAPFHSLLGAARFAKRDWDGAADAYREAIRLFPTMLDDHVSLGNALYNKRDLDGAAASYREAVRLRPEYAHAHFRLGITLHDKGDWDGAVAEYRETVRLDAKHDLAHYNLGILLHARHDLDGAVAEYREAIRLNPKSALNHFRLGISLSAKGDLDGAAGAYREAVRIEPKDQAAKAALARVERWQELTARLPDILAGRAEPKTPAEGCEFANLCSRTFQQRFTAASRLYAAAFDADPMLADDVAAGHRYNAACYAARAARGDGVDVPPDPAGRDALRVKALAWLRADLAVHRRLAASQDAAGRKLAADKLTHWLRDTDLSALRPGLARIGMPADERAVWDAFWAEVRTTRDNALNPSPGAR